MESDHEKRIDRFRFKNIEHTADKAIIAYGSTFPEMLESAAAGMFSQQVDITTVPREKSWHVKAEADSAEDLLVAWLRELIVLSEDEEAALCDYRIISFSEWKLEGEVTGASYGNKRVRRTGAVVKAITYHNLAVRHNDEWQGQVTFDV